MSNRLAPAVLASSLLLLLAACGTSPMPDTAASAPTPSLGLSALALGPGALDTTFGTKGEVTVGGDQHAVATLADGTLLVVGTEGGDFALTRVSPGGTLQRTRMDLGGNDTATGVFVQKNGKVLVVGQSGGNFALVRLRRDLTPDAGPGQDGVMTTSLRDLGMMVSAATLQRDGKILVVGTTLGDDFRRSYALARFLPNGRLDLSFGDRGKVVTHPDPSAIQYEGQPYQGSLTSVAVQDDGQIMVGGEANFVEAGYYPSAALLRYSKNGTLDTTYGQGGRVWLWSGRHIARVDGLLTSGNGEVVAVGRTYIFECNVARVRPDGRQPQIAELLSAGLASYPGPMAVARQADGKLLVSGCSRYELGQPSSSLYDSVPTVARLKSDLTLDLAFGQGGSVAVTDAGQVLVQPDGKIVTGLSTLTRLLP